MKKIVAMVWALAMCLSLCACGDGGEISENEELVEKEFNLCQEWLDVEAGRSVTFHQDGTCTHPFFGGGTAKYSYDEETALIKIETGPGPRMRVVFEDDLYKLYADGIAWVPTALYDQYHAAYLESPISRMHQDGYIGIYYYRFGECIREIVELSTENWSEYIKVCSYTEAVDILDAFGEVIRTETRNVRCLGACTENLYYRYEDVVLELEDTQTGEKIIFELGTKLGEEVSAEFDLTRYKCSRIKGKVYLVELPEEAILSPVPTWDYRCGYILIGRGDIPYEINPYTKEIYPNGQENWEEKFMQS